MINKRDSRVQSILDHAWNTVGDSAPLESAKLSVLAMLVDAVRENTKELKRIRKHLEPNSTVVIE